MRTLENSIDRYWNDLVDYRHIKIINIENTIILYLIKIILFNSINKRIIHMVFGDIKMISIIEHLLKVNFV